MHKHTATFITRSLRRSDGTVEYREGCSCGAARPVVRRGAHVELGAWDDHRIPQWALQDALEYRR